MCKKFKRRESKACLIAGNKGEKGNKKEQGNERVSYLIIERLLI